MKTAQKYALYGLGATAIAVPLVFLAIRKVQAASLRQIRYTSQVLMGMPEDDSPCADEPVLIWGDAPLQAYADTLGAEVLEQAATAENLRSAILDKHPSMIYLFGHGNVSVYTCQACERFFLSGGLNLDLVAGRYVHLLSCETGYDLGKKIVAAGAVGYFGYKDTFLCLTKETPGSGRFVTAPFLCDIEIQKALVEGQTDLKAIYDRAIARINTEIVYWQNHWAQESCNGSRIYEAEAQMLITALTHNRDCLVYYPS
jgi:hypothetical protein